MPETVICEICDFKGDWEECDSVHGTMWGCDRCDKFFCEKCFADKLGYGEYNKMIGVDSDTILCPDCYAK